MPRLHECAAPPIHTANVSEVKTKIKLVLYGPPAAATNCQSPSDPLSSMARCARCAVEDGWAPLTLQLAL